MPAKHASPIDTVTELVADLPFPTWVDLQEGAHITVRVPSLDAAPGEIRNRMTLVLETLRDGGISGAWRITGDTVVVPPQRRARAGSSR